MSESVFISYQIFFSTGSNNDLSLYFIHYRTCGSNFAHVPHTVFFKLVENISTGISLETKNHRNFLLRIEDVFVPFLNKLQEANDFLEQPFIVSSVVDELCTEQQFFKLGKWIKLIDLFFHTTGYREILLEKRHFNIHCIPINCFRHSSNTTN